MNSNYLRALLDSKGVRPSQLAKKIGITTVTMNRKIKGDFKFSEKDINVILKELDMSYDEVFGDNDNVIVIINSDKYIVSSKTATKIISTIVNDKKVV